MRKIVNMSTVSKMTRTLCQSVFNSGMRTQLLHKIRDIRECQTLSVQSRSLLGCGKTQSNSVISVPRAGLHTCSLALGPTTLSGHKGDNTSSGGEASPQTGWVIRLANENGYLSWCRNTYLATVVGVGMWAEGPSSIAFHATEGALFLGGLNLVLGTVSYLHTIFRVRKTIHMSIVGAGLHTLAALTHLGMWLTVVITYLGYVEAEEEVRHPGTGIRGFERLERREKFAPQETGVGENPGK